MSECGGQAPPEEPRAWELGVGGRAGLGPRRGASGEAVGLADRGLPGGSPPASEETDSRFWKFLWMGP